MKCPQCPVSPARPCHGETDHPPACGYVAAGRQEWIEHLVRMAEGLPPAPTVDVRLAMLADLCSSGSGPCGCSGPPRLCGHPAHPLEVWRSSHCLPCVARSEWAAGSDPIG